MMEIKTLNPTAFKPYGQLIAFTDAKEDGWEIVVTHKSAGWRVALLEFSRKAATRLEHHPNSKETFEPISGVALLIVAKHDSPEDYEVFLLDQPISINPGIWHEVISLSEMTQVKITENLDVTCVYRELPLEIAPRI